MSRIAPTAPTEPLRALRRRHSAGRGAVPSPHRRHNLRTTRISAIADGLEHEVAEDEVGLGQIAGLYRALCGTSVAPSSLTVEPGPPCRACAVEADPAPEPLGEAPRGQRRAVSRWLQRATDRTARQVPRRALPDVGVLDDAA